MPIVMITVDTWVPISADYEIFVRPDELTDPEYRVRIEASVVDGLQVRCLSPLPAGFWLRPIRTEPRVPAADRYTTAQFRIDMRDPP